jgi:hypothetical protein
MKRLDDNERSDPDVWRAHLGRKASMRLRNPGDPLNPFTEAIGVIQSVDHHPRTGWSLTVVSKRGETRTVAIEDVLAAKVF